MPSPTSRQPAFLPESGLSTLRSLLVVGLLAVASAAFLYNAPQLTECFWRAEDCDFCYATTALRWLDGLRIGYIDHPGYSVAQVMGWFFLAAESLGFIEEASFAALAADPDPLFRIKAYVFAGWALGFCVYLFVSLLVTVFIRRLSGVAAAGLAAGLLAASSASLLLFAINIRPEGLSLAFGLLSILLAAVASRTDRWWVFCAALEASGAALGVALLAKTQVLPLLALVPGALLLERDLAIDRATRAERRRAGSIVALASLGMLLPSASLLRPWEPFRTKGFWTLGLALTVVLSTVCIPVLRRLFYRQPAGPRRLAADGLLLTGLWILGLQLAIPAAFIHPRPDLRASFSAMAADVGYSMLLITDPGINARKFMTAPDVGALVDQARATATWYVTERWSEISIVAMTVIALRRRFSPERRWAFYFWLVGVVLLFESSLRSIADFYIAYEEIPTILALGMCFAVWWGYARDSRKSDRARTILSTICVTAAVGLVVLRAVGAYHYRQALGCPELLAVSASGACICNPVYAVRTGLKPVIEAQYNLPCLEAVDRRAKQGWDHRLGAGR